VSNLPAGLAGKQVFVTQFIVDATHSNPYSVWTSQSKPTAPTEAQLQAMKAAQHLALLQPVTTTTLTTSYTTTFTINRQAGTLLILSLNRPVTGRNGLVTMEGEDYDGQSSATKEDSNDSDLGQSIVGNNGSYVFYDVVDFGDAGVNSVQMRVNAASPTNLEFHADSQTGTLLGKCALGATAGAWATQTCALSAISGVHTLYVVFDGTAHLNWILFQKGASTTGTGGAAGGATGSGGSSATGGSGGSTTSGSGGSGTGSGGTTVTGSGGSGAGGSSGSGGSGSGTGGIGSGGSGATGSGGSASGGSPGSGGSAPGAAGSGGCACTVGSSDGPVPTLLPFGLVTALVGLRRRRRSSIRK
jgi:MYXO-CTERM domain-containing protein